MKVVMINDCAYVGETILRYLPENIEKVHIKRSRGIMSKTVGIGLKLIRARGDIYHVNYLLQDAYLALKFGKKPILGHAHGSDLRTTLRSSKWGWLVKSVLIKVDKVVVSTPDILDIAKEYRDDAIYIPNPVDTELFYLRKDDIEKVSKNKDRIKVLIASNSDWRIKGTDVAIKALAKIKNSVKVSIIHYGVDFNRTVKLASDLGLKIRILDRVPHNRLRKYFWDADVVIDRFKLGSLGMVSLEAIASGRPVVTYVSSEFPEYRDFPLKDVRNVDEIAEAVLNADRKLWKKQYEYLVKHHEPHKVANQFLGLYNEMIERSRH